MGSVCLCDFIVAYDWYTVWRVIFGGAKFREKSEKALRINFHDSNPAGPGARHCAKDDVIDTGSCELDIARFPLSLSHFCKETWTNSMRVKDISLEYAISWMIVAIIAC